MKASRIAGWAAPILRAAALVTAGSIVGSISSIAQAQSAPAYPSKPIRVVIPYAPGGGSDTLARVIGAKIQERTGQSVIIENRAGAGGNLGAEFVARAAPDGYTLMLTAHPPLVVNKALYAKLGYDPDAFVPISVLTTANSLLLVNPKVPATTLREFIAYAKANPDKLNYASQGVGNNAHLSAELFKSMAGVKIVHVPYKGTGPAVADLLAGQVDMMIVDGSTVSAHVRAGKLRVLGIGTETREPAMPGVPAIAEELPGYLALTWQGLVAPPGTPPAIANTLSNLVASILKQPDVIARMGELHFTIVGSTPSDMATFMKQERARWGGVIRASNATAE